jgi:hypothetical protein
MQCKVTFDPSILGIEQMKTSVLCVLSVLVAASLAGCDKGPKKDVKEGEGPAIRIPGTNAVVGAKLPDNLPAYVAIYPGSEVVATIVGMDNKKARSIVSLRVKAAMADVVAFYRDADAKNGLKIKGEFSTEAVHSLNAESEDRSKALSIIVSAGDEGGVSVQLTYR